MNLRVILVALQFILFVASYVLDVQMKTLVFVGFMLILTAVMVKE